MPLMQRTKTLKRHYWRADAMGVTILVCTSCRAPAEPDDAATAPAGHRLLAAVKEAAGNSAAATHIVGHECLWACRQGCTVLFRATDRTGYLAGRFVPGAQTARAIVDWAAAMARSVDGTVPWPEWPEGMKGHFLARLPAEKDME
jgi:predicted metal-binding protein